MPLGRSLTALLSESDSARQRKESRSVSEVAPMPSFGEGTAQAAGAPEGLIEVSLELLNPSKYQPRQFFDEDKLSELAASIKEHGLLEPLLVRRVNDRFEIICGERRFRAARMAGLESVPCLVSDVLEKDAYAIALVENLQRQDLNPIEEAAAYSLVLKECGLTQEELAKSVGRSRSAVANVLRLNTLDEAVKEYVAAGQLDMGHARALLAIDDRKLQAKTAGYVVSKGLSVRQTEVLVRELKENQGNEEKKSKPARPVSFDDFEKRLSSDLLGAKVKFTVTGVDKGKVTLAYASAEQLEGILDKLGLKSGAAKTEIEAEA